MADWQETLMLAGAIRAGLLDALAESPGDAGDVARRCGCDRRATALLLSALADLGYLNRDSSPPPAEELESAVYSLTDQSRMDFIDEPETAGFPRHVILHRANMMQSWLEIPEILRTGAPPNRDDRREELATSFLGAMNAYGSQVADEIAERVVCIAPGASTLVDLGGATGAYSRAFTRLGLRVTMVDTPGTIDRVAARLSEDGISTFAGDLFEELPEGPFDIAFLSNITHIYGPAENAKLVSRVKEIVSPGGFVVIADLVRGMTDHAPIFAVNMLVHTATGSTWTKGDYEAWLTAADYEEIEFHEMNDGGRVLIVGRRPTE